MNPAVDLAESETARQFGPQNGLQSLAPFAPLGYTRSGRCGTLEAHSIEQKRSGIFVADVEGCIGLMERDELAREVA
jgi:hypothetical protein